MRVAPWTAFFFAATSACLAACNDGNLQSLVPDQFAQPPETVSLIIMNYTPQPGNTFKDLFVSNFSVKAAQGLLQLSTARDGIPDTLKQALIPQFGFTLNGSAYSANPGFSDFVLSLMGVQFSQQSLLNCPSSQRQSSSNDAFSFADTRYPGSPPVFLGLRDCEKQYLGLNPATFDNSGSGIPDYLKLRCGLNPKNTHDWRLDVSGEGLTNYDKCKEHIAIDENANSQANKLFAYQYQLAVLAAGSQNMSVSNIPILNGGQDNLIAMYVTETHISTQAEALFTAFTILGPGSTGRVLKTAYWATDPSKFVDQEIVFQ